MFARRSGKPKLEYYPNTTSQAYLNGALVYANASGAVIPADSTSGNHIGITQETITSADARYTTAGKICVDVLDPNDIVEALVSGTLTTSMITNFYDLTDSVTVNVAAQSKAVVLCVGFISTTKGLFKINSMATYKDVAVT